LGKQQPPQHGALIFWHKGGAVVFNGEPDELMVAIARGDEQAVITLISQKHELNIRREDGYTPGHVAIEKGCPVHLRILKLILDAGASPELRGPNGWTWLHMAVNDERPDFVRLILKYGPEIDAGSYIDEDDTPLMIAAYRGNCKIIAMLLSHKANAL